MITVRSLHRTSHYLSDSDIEVEVQFEPVEYSDIHMKQIGDKLVVAYLSLDSDPTNPMENSDCNGDIYLKPSQYAYNSTINDDMSALIDALKVDGHGWIDDEATFNYGGEVKTIREHAADLVSGDVMSGEIDALCLNLYKENWREIVGPYVVPIHYHRERGCTSIGSTSWDGDPEYLPDGVWAACRCAIKNIEAAQVIDPSVTAEKYAQSILEEYGNWCDGDVYGCCIEIFEENNGYWSSVYEDACWGFIGITYAQQALLEDFFIPRVKSLS